MISPKIYTIFILTLLVAGFCIRGYKLDAREYAMDEESFVLFSEHVSFENLLLNRVNSYFPPLPSLLTNIWIVFFGRALMSIRMITIIFNLAGALLFSHLIAKLFKDRKASIYAFALFMFSGALIYYARLARMYSMFFFFAAFSYYSFYMCFFNGKTSWKYYVLFSLSSILLSQSHPLAALFILPQLFLVIRKGFPSAKRFVLIQSITFLANLYYYSTIVHLFFEKGNTTIALNLNWIPRPGPSGFFSFLAKFFLGSEFNPYMLRILLLVCVLLIFIFSWIFTRNYSFFAIPLVVYFWIIFIFSYINHSFSLFNFDYLFPLMGFSLALVALSLSKMRTFGLLLLVLLIVGNVLAYPSLYTENHEFRDTVDYIVRHNMGNDLNIVPYPLNVIYQIMNTPAFENLSRQEKMQVAEYIRSAEDQVRFFNNVSEAWLVFIHSPKPDFVHDPDIILNQTNKRVVESVVFGRVQTFHLMTNETTK